ncbi:MAG TPA: flagellar motor switch protein FliN [bacterium]|nr:flagellar motor switch protein FliN [bacterium]
MVTILKNEDEKKLVTPVEFAPISDTAIELTNRDIGIYVDLPKEIVVELGKTKMTLREILELDISEVIELNKQAGESVDIFVDGELIAKGEVVIIDDKFGVRITEIVRITDIEKKII